MVYRTRWSLAALTLLALAACNDSDTTGFTPAPTAAPQRGELLTKPPVLVASYGVSDLLGLLPLDNLGRELLTLTFSPVCTVSVYRLEYRTVGAKSELTTGTGALMVPTGADSSCQGPRPIVEYAHGTSPHKDYDIAQLTGSNASSEGLILAALFAAEGYIVVAPNYAGYDTSTLTYHPYLVAAQQANDMIDALTAARSALPVSAATGVVDNHKLYITGYSQGGYVAMAAHRALQAAGQVVTASAPMSGPYALAAFGDAVFLGRVNLSATENVALLTNAYQNAYGNLYSQPTDAFALPYATDIEGLLPSTTPISTLYDEHLLPQNELFSSTPPAPQYASITPATTPANLAPVFALGFGSAYLIANSYRLAYLQDQAANPDGGFPTVTTGIAAAAPANTLRHDLKTNDLRNWTPTAPVLLCGGSGDPDVFFLNTQLMQRYWTVNSPTALATVVDLDSSATPADQPYEIEKLGFAAAVEAVKLAAIVGGANDGGEAAVLADYHTVLVAPFCLFAAKSFFDGH